MHHWGRRRRFQRLNCRSRFLLMLNLDLLERYHLLGWFARSVLFGSPCRKHFRFVNRLSQFLPEPSQRSDPLYPDLLWWCQWWNLFQRVLFRFPPGFPRCRYRFAFQFEQFRSWYRLWCLWSVRLDRKLLVVCSKGQLLCRFAAAVDRMGAFDQFDQ